MEICIMNYDSKDEAEFKRLLNLSFEDNDLLYIIKSTKLRYAYSAYYGDKLVGVVITWASDNHPFCTYFRIIIHPFFQELKIVERLLSKVEDLGLADCPLQTSVWETAINIKEAYENNGFEVIRKTYMPILAVSEIKYMRPFNDDDYILRTLADISLDQHLMKKLTHKVKSTYERNHLANPVAELGVDKWKKMILDDAVLSASYVYLDSQEKDVVAYSFLHKSKENDILDLGWCGGSNKALIPQLISNQIKYAQREGILFLRGEFDTSDPDAMEVLKIFPFAPCATRITYRKI